MNRFLQHKSECLVGCLAAPTICATSLAKLPATSRNILQIAPFIDHPTHLISKISSVR